MPATALANVGLVPASQWDDVLRGFPAYTVFHTGPWLQTLAEEYHVKVWHAQWCVDGMCKAVWPLLETRKGLFRILGSPLPGCCTAYMGPLFSDDCDVNTALDAFLSDSLCRRCAFFACKSLNDTNVGPIDLSSHGFVDVLQFETYCLDLRLPNEHLWANLKGTCRTQIRKAQKLGIEIHEECDDSFMDEYWAMSLDTFANTNIQPPYSRQLIERMWKNLHPAGRLRVLSAWHDGRRVAALVLPLDDHTMYYWGGATYDADRPLPAHNLLHWHAISQAQAMGLRRYDFVATLGGAGRFKRTFGPQTVTSATHWERTSSRLVKVLRDGYERFLMKRQTLTALG